MKTIWAKGKLNIKNCTVAFAFSTTVSGENAKLEIVAANVYRLFVNGEFIGYGPARASHGYVRKDAYNLSKYFKETRLVIIAEVFSSNVNSYYLVDESPFFGAVLTIDTKEIASTRNNDFKAYPLSDRITKVQRYSFQRPFAEAYYMKKYHKAFYNGDFSLFEQVEVEEASCGKVIERNIGYPTLEKKDYLNVIEQGKVFIDNSLPKWTDRSIFEIGDELRGYKYDELDVCLSDDASSFVYKLEENKKNDKEFSSNSYKLFDFGRTVTGFFNLNLKVKAKTDLYILWDEIIWHEDKPGQKEKNICFYRNDCCNIIKYILEPGDFDLLAFEPATARYVKIIVLKGEIELDGFNIILYENSSAYNFKFFCDDKKLQDIVEAATNTFAQNAVDILTDCPSRERAGWLCDTYFSARTEKLLTGKNAIEKNFLQNYYFSPQLEDLPVGMIPMCYPADHYNKMYIPNWAMWYVIELYDYLNRTADRELIENSRHKVYGIIDYFKQYLNSDGLLEDLESWVFIEWSKSNDKEFVKGVNYPSNMLYSKMLCVAGTMYNDKELILQGQNIKKMVIEQSFNGKFFEDNRVRENGILVNKGHISETCQYYAFYFDVADVSNFSKLFKILINDFGPKRDCEKVYPYVYKSNAFIGNYLRFEILLKNSMELLVIDECKEFFYFMAERTGTLWEHSFAFGSLNHGFASIAAKYIVECTTGFIEVDNATKAVYLSEPAIECNVNVKIPVLDQFLEIVITDKKRNIKLPENYFKECIN